MTHTKSKRIEIRNLKSYEQEIEMEIMQFLSNRKYGTPPGLLASMVMGMIAGASGGEYKI